jgi:hypothetical protein
LNRVAPDENGRSDPFGVKGRGDARRAPAPIVPGDREPLDAERVGEIDHILADRRLLGHAWSGRISKTRRAVSTKVRNEDAMACFRQRWGDIVPRAHVIRETVKQDDWKSG